MIRVNGAARNSLAASLFKYARTPLNPKMTARHKKRNPITSFQSVRAGLRMAGITYFRNSRLWWIIGPFTAFHRSKAGLWRLDPKLPIESLRMRSGSTTIEAGGELHPWNVMLCQHIH
jgi:hypothetical protein